MPDLDQTVSDITTKILFQLEGGEEGGRQSYGAGASDKVLEEIAGDQIMSVVMNLVGSNPNIDGV